MSILLVHLYVLERLSNLIKYISRHVDTVILVTLSLQYHVFSKSK